MSTQVANALGDRVKADKNGNFYAWFSPRGFANEGTIYFVEPKYIEIAEQIDSKARLLNGGCLNFINAKTAMKETRHPANIENHPWFDDFSE